MTRSPKITMDEVRRVAMLARLDLSSEEETAIAADLDRILKYVDLLSEIDTDSIEPMAHVANVPTPFREDTVTSSPNTDTLVGCAPTTDGAFFKVPKIIE